MTKQKKGFNSGSKLQLYERKKESDELKSKTDIVYIERMTGHAAKDISRLAVR